MGSEPNRPNEVRDGVQDQQEPEPRDTAGHGKTGDSAESADSTSDSNVTAGPAEERDRETPDDRGLTTDTTSSE
jgi:hypothetical protein